MATLGSQSEAWPSHEGVRPGAAAKISWVYVTYQPGICHVKSLAERAGGLTVTKEPTKWFRYVIVFELGLGEGVAAQVRWAPAGPGHPEGDQQRADRFRRPGGAAIAAMVCRTARLRVMASFGLPTPIRSPGTLLPCSVSRN
jgi:hypothetical protein